MWKRVCKFSPCIRWRAINDVLADSSNLMDHTSKIIYSSKFDWLFPGYESGLSWKKKPTELRFSLHQEHDLISFIKYVDLGYGDYLVSDNTGCSIDPNFRRFPPGTRQKYPKSASIVPQSFQHRLSSQDMWSSCHAVTSCVNCAYGSSSPCHLAPAY